MTAFLKYEEWEDYWCFKPTVELDFSILKKLDYCSWCNKKSEITTRIESFDDAEEPSKGQIETLDFILEHQNEILDAIFNFNQRFIYPIYAASIDIEEEEIVNNQSELSRVFGIRYIEIPPLGKTNSVYFLLQFDFRYDDEHGLYLLFENTSVIDFFSEGDKNLDAIDVYQNGLTNENGKPLELHLYQIPFQSVYKNTCSFDEFMEHPLKKGAYRASVKCNEIGYRINFYTPNDLERFSLKQVLSMK